LNRNFLLIMKLNEKTNFENDYDSNKFQLINSWLLLKHWENLYQSNGTVYYSIKLCTYKMSWIWVQRWVRNYENLMRCKNITYLYWVNSLFVIFGQCLSIELPNFKIIDFKMRFYNNYNNNNRKTLIRRKSLISWKNIEH
jgi:hypothetical protein